MGIFKNIFNNDQNQTPVNDPMFDTIYQYLNDDDFDTDSKNVWTVSSDVFSVVTRLANDIADKPLLSDTAYQSSLFNSNVSPDMTSRNWLEASIINLCLWGDSFTLIQTDKNNMVSDLVLLPTPDVTVLQGSNGLTYSYKNEQTFNEDQILHFRLNTINGMVGNSPLRSLRNVLKLSRASNRSLQKYYENLSFSRFILSVNDKLSSQDKLKLKEAFKKNLGLNSDGSSIVTDNSVKVTPLNVSGINGDILKQTKQNDYFASKICSAFHVPGFVLGVQNPHQNTDSEYAEYRLSLKPYMNIICNELSSKLSGNYRFKDTIEPLTCDDVSNLVKSGVLNSAEAKQYLGFN